MKDAVKTKMLDQNKQRSASLNDGCQHTRSAKPAVRLRASEATGGIVGRAKAGRTEARRTKA